MNANLYVGSALTDTCRIALYAPPEQYSHLVRSYLVTQRIITERISGQSPALASRRRNSVETATYAPPGAQRDGTKVPRHSYSRLKWIIMKRGNEQSPYWVFTADLLLQGDQ